jgi:hypothetical protein
VGHPGAIEQKSIMRRAEAAAWVVPACAAPPRAFAAIVAPSQSVAEKWG